MRGEEIGEERSGQILLILYRTRCFSMEARILVFCLCSGSEKEHWKCKRYLESRFSLYSFFVLFFVVVSH